MEQVTHLVEESKSDPRCIGIIHITYFLYPDFPRSFLQQMEKRYLRMMGEGHPLTGGDVDPAQCSGGEILEHVEDILERQRTIDKRMEHCVQKVGMVRYNAFNDMERPVIP